MSRYSIEKIHQALNENLADNEMIEYIVNCIKNYDELENQSNLYLAYMKPSKLYDKKSYILTCNVLSEKCQELQKENQELKLKAEKYDAVYDTLSDKHICEIEQKFSKYQDRCNKAKCDDCPLIVGNEMCIKCILESKWEISKERDAFREQSAKLSKENKILKDGVNLLWNIIDELCYWGENSHIIEDGESYRTYELDDKEYELANNLKAMLEARNE